MHHIYRLFAIVNGNWGMWGAWRTCSRTCGSGTRTRSRSCCNPTPAHGGSNCPGNKYDTTQCSKPKCRGIYVIIECLIFFICTFYEFESNSLRGVLDTTSCDKLYQQIVVGCWVFPGTAVSKETTMKRHRMLQPHVQVFIRIECVFSSICFYFLNFCFVLSVGNNIGIIYYTVIRFHDKSV
jgi:hypothetical protein